jgi:hypothetical protein
LELKDWKMASSDRYRIDQKYVAYEVFDGEILAVNLETGVYYSLQDVSVKIWDFIAAGMSIGEIAKALEAQFDAKFDVIEPQVSEFVTKMIGEGLVVLGAPDRPVALAPTVAGQKKPFTTPEMSIYADMQDLLLLDPIHDVDDAGWPVLKPADRPD